MRRRFEVPAGEVMCTAAPEDEDDVDTLVDGCERGMRPRSAVRTAVGWKDGPAVPLLMPPGAVIGVLWGPFGGEVMKGAVRDGRGSTRGGDAELRRYVKCINR